MKTLQEIKREYILQVLDHTNWDLKKASEILKVSEDFLKKEIQKDRTGAHQSVSGQIEKPFI